MSPQNRLLIEADSIAMEGHDDCEALLTDRRPTLRILFFGLLLASANLALSIAKSSRVYLFEQAQCRSYYLARDPISITSENPIKESLCKLEAVQTPLSLLVGLDSCLASLPGIIPKSLSSTCPLSVLSEEVPTL